jgi:type VI secretion system protein VasD
MVDMPMEESAQYVAVAGMFMSPDQENNTWRVVLSRDDLDPDKAASSKRATTADPAGAER